MVVAGSGLSLLSVLWYLIGFSLTFGHSLGGIIGNPVTHAIFLNVPFDDCLPNTDMHVAGAAYALFEMYVHSPMRARGRRRDTGAPDPLLLHRRRMFAAISPLLITGSFAERVKWRAFLIFCISWEVLVYYPVAHWVWGGGWLDTMGVLDFAGGIVIHTTAGVSALVAALGASHSTAPRPQAAHRATHRHSRRAAPDVLPTARRISAEQPAARHGGRCALVDGMGACRAPTWWGGGAAAPPALRRCASDAMAP